MTHGVAIGDNTVVEGLPDLAAFVGSGSRVGHNAVIRGSYVDEEVSVGDSATVLESRVDSHAMIADGAVVHNAHVQSGQVGPVLSLWWRGCSCGRGCEGELREGDRV